MEPFSNYLLIAPCGMNCGICMAYLRERNKCPGCRDFSTDKAKTRLACKIKNCAKTVNGFCYECEDFPCKKLAQLDKRYRTKYSMSMIENQLTIKNTGMERFLESEKAKWTCMRCAGTMNVHKKICSKCGEKQ